MHTVHRGASARLGCTNSEEGSIHAENLADIGTRTQNSVQTAKSHVCRVLLNVVVSVCRELKSDFLGPLP